MGQLDLFSPATKQDSPEKKQITRHKATDDGGVNDDLVPGESREHAGIAFNEDPVVNSKAINEKVVVFADEQIRVKLKEVPANDTPAGKETLTKHANDFSHKQPAEVKDLKILQKRGRKSLKEIDAVADLIEIPEDEILFRKQYYSISEVAGWFKVNTSLLRFWETEFDILKPRKNRKGDRMFRPEDVKNLQLIHHLLRDRKYTIDGAKDYIKGNKKKADTQLQLTQSLQKFKSFLLELKANLQG